MTLPEAKKKIAEHSETVLFIRHNRTPKVHGSFKLLVLVHLIMQDVDENLSI